VDEARPIAAIATAPGRGAIGVVRVSGRGLAPIVAALIGSDPLPPRHARFAAFLDAGGEAIDRGIAILFPAPASYTGEDVFELQAHGGRVVLERLLARVLEAGRSLGIRVARPGEFTERAFLNGKLDLAQAEAVADLIDASTEQAARAAVRSLEGEFSRTVSSLAERLLELRMLVEATLDFPEEEIDFLEAAQARERLAACVSALEEVRSAARRGALLRDGITVVLAGEPNVGKSSLLNALAGAELAIVTPIAGTTRDRIAQAIQIEGVAINVVDTAGLRETEDEVERIGIERTWQAVEAADVVVHLVDARAIETDAARALEDSIRCRVGRSVPVLRVFNKIDLIDLERPVAIGAARGEGGADSGPSEPSGAVGIQRGAANEMAISALTGAGIDALRKRLLELAGGEPGAETVFTARARHVEALAVAARHLEAAVALLAQGGQALDLLAEELRLAHEALGEITGQVSPDQLLGEIFSRFCIGK